MINLTTGPVAVTEAVRQVFSLPEVSHRSAEFMDLHHKTTGLLCRALRVKHSFVVTGSGTLANDVMLAQIAQLHQPGLIISNGEFGERLAVQADRFGVAYKYIKKNWGTPINLQEIEDEFIDDQVQWLLLCHCETSTGQLVDLDGIFRLSKKYGCKIFLDCMSSFGAQSLNLAHVAMATASSGKGAGSVAGLALVFSNLTPQPCAQVPLYLDLHYVQTCGGVPFTMSFHLLMALYASLQHNLLLHHWQQLDVFSYKIYNHLQPLGIIPFSRPSCRVFTIMLPFGHAQILGHHLAEANILSSFQSPYLKQRGWLQLAIFGKYELKDINRILDTITLLISKYKLINVDEPALR